MAPEALKTEHFEAPTGSQFFHRIPSDSELSK